MHATGNSPGATNSGKESVAQKTVTGHVTGHSEPQNAEQLINQGVGDHERDADLLPPANTGLKPEKARYKFSKACMKTTKLKKFVYERPTVGAWFRV